MDYPNEDCNKREFKSKIIDETLNLPKKSSKTRKASVKSGTKLSITTSILELLKILSEVIAASKYGPLARIKYQKPIKYQNSNYGIPLDLQKRSSNIENKIEYLRLQ